MPNNGQLCLDGEQADVVVGNALLETEPDGELVVVEGVYPDDDAVQLEHLVEAAAGDLDFQFLAWFDFRIGHQAQACLRDIPHHVGNAGAERATLTAFDPQPATGALANGTAAIGIVRFHRTRLDGG